MTRLLWLAFAAAVAALLIACLLEWLFPKSAIPARWEEPADGLPPFDPEVWARAQQRQSRTIA